MNIRKYAARLSAVLSLAAAGASWAQMTPLGTWHNIDDKTGEIKSELRVYEVDGGAIHGRVEKLLRKDAKLVDTGLKVPKSVHEDHKTGKR